MKKLIILIFTFFCIFSTLACDVCNTFDYAQDQNNTFIGLFRRYSFNNGYNNKLSLLNFSLIPQKKRHGGNTQNYFVNKTGTDYETSLTHELFVNKNFNNNVLIQFRLPFTKNITYLNEVTPIGIGSQQDTLVETQGLGDASFGIYKIKLIENKHINHRINYGLNIQIPTGKYNTFTGNDFIDVRHSPGTGAWSFSPRIQYYNNINKRYGISAQVLYNWSTKRKTSTTGSAIGTTINGDYRFGDIFSTQAMFYYTIKKSLLKIIPKIGAVYTNEAKDIFLKKEVTTSGGSLSEALFGLDIRREKLGLRIQYLIPLQQTVHNDLVRKKGSYQLGVYYNFGKKNKKEDSNQPLGE